METRESIQITTIERPRRKPQGYRSLLRYGFVALLLATVGIGLLQLSRRLGVVSGTESDILLHVAQKRISKIPSLNAERSRVKTRFTASASFQGTKAVLSSSFQKGPLSPKGT